MSKYVHPHLSNFLIISYQSQIFIKYYTEVVYHIIFIVIIVQQQFIYDVSHTHLFPQFCEQMKISLSSLHILPSEVQSAGVLKYVLNIWFCSYKYTHHSWKWYLSKRVLPVEKTVGKHSYLAPNHSFIKITQSSSIALSRRWGDNLWHA